MVNNDYTMNGMLVFSRPIKINDTEIYGLLYDQDFEKLNAEKGNKLDAYVAYLVGAEYFLKNNGKISEDGRLWTLPDGVHTIASNISLHRLLDVLLKGIVDFQTLEFDKPIVWEKGEVDDDGNAARIITNPELINRYIVKDGE